MKVQKLTAIGAIALAMTFILSGDAQARHIHEVRGHIAVIRGHSLALREFLRAKCRVCPDLAAAQALSEQLACRADELWDLVRRDCALTPQQIEARLCAVEQQYRLTNSAVRAVAVHAPRHHVHHACHLLERIDQNICRVRRVLTAWTPVPPVIHHRVQVQRPTFINPHLRLRNPYVQQHLRPHVQPHLGPHLRPHVQPHVNWGSRVGQPRIGQPRIGQPRIGHPRVGHQGKVHLRIGGFSVCF